MSSFGKKLLSPVVVRVFAVIGLLFVVVMILGGMIAAHFAFATPSEPDKVVLTIDFDRAIVEQNSPSPLDLASHDEPVALLDVVHAINNARRDPHVKGILAHFGGAQPSLAHTEEINAALERFRKAGKFTYAFGSSYGAFGDGNRAYLLASGFEKIWLQPVGSVSLTGVAMEAPFGKTALARFGVGSDFMRREEYKSFEETFTRDNFSEPVRQNMQSMLDSLAGLVAIGVADGRKWDAAKVTHLMAGGPYTADEAFKLGLVTHIGYSDDLNKEIDTAAGDDAVQVALDDYLAFGDGAQPDPKADIALIYGTGMIADHGSGAAEVTGEDVMGADTVAAAFNDAADDKKIKAILFRVDSPGGSPEASETIRAALIRAQKAGKLVFVSMGDVAASGGYWVAMSADYIVAEPGTITGSIGVLAGKFLVGDLLAKFGVGLQTLSSDPNAGMWSMARAFTPQQRARMNAYLDETYRDFTTGVADARKIPIAKMSEIAKGRVFTGEQALKIGLVDRLGGFEETLDAVKEKLKLDPTDTVLMEEFPPPESASERILHLLKNVGVETSLFGAISADLRQSALLLPLMQAITGKAISTRLPPAVQQLSH